MTNKNSKGNIDKYNLVFGIINAYRPLPKGQMEKTILRIIDEVKGSLDSNAELDDRCLDRIVRQRNREMHDAVRHVAKKRILPYYLKVKREDPQLWNSWNVDESADEAIIRLLRAKPRRTASGVATITVLTKPWTCSSDCIYCPNDIRMPKSYMHSEPACQRAERNFFDPYLQVASRLRVLEDMGHITDKVELIVLGGTWSDYPLDYRTWFVAELFRALNDAETSQLELNCEQRRGFYSSAESLCDPDELARAAEGVQRAVDRGDRTFNESVFWREIPSVCKDIAISELDDMLISNQRANEAAKNRVVGLVVETRPDSATIANLRHLRYLGCTKVQIGIQSLDGSILKRNRRHISIDKIAEAFSNLRLFGFKSHVHLMVNLLGASVEGDKDEYIELVSDGRFIPDEVKLYPCALVESARLNDEYKAGRWQPYSEEELLDVLSFDVFNSPEYVRISRMIRDISATDILVGNKKTNLRQLVEMKVKEDVADVADINEMRLREIATSEIDANDLRMQVIPYKTTVSDERFIEFVDAENRLAAFLRLSLPKAEAMERFAEEMDILDGEKADRPLPCKGGFSALDARSAMIREVHVYGKVSRLHEAKDGAQHIGLGQQMIEHACEIARDAGYSAINVISAIGTKEYYRALGFSDVGLYLRKGL